jgi:hypothetical protein
MKENINPSKQELNPESSSAQILMVLAMASVAMTSVAMTAITLNNNLDGDSRNNRGPIEGCQGTVATVLERPDSTMSRSGTIAIPGSKKYRVGIVTKDCYPDNDTTKDPRYTIFDTKFVGAFNPGDPVTYTKNGWTSVDVDSTPN